MACELKSYLYLLLGLASQASTVEYFVMVSSGELIYPDTIGDLAIYRI